MFVRFVKSLPVIFISLIICWSYYAYVVAVVLTAMVDSVVEQVVCVVLYHCLAIMFVWSYYMVVFTPPGTVPPSWRLAQADVERLALAQSEDEWKTILSSLAAQLGCLDTVKQRSVQNAVGGTALIITFICIRPSCCRSGIVRNVCVSSQTGLTTVQCARTALLRWTITALGSTTAWAFIIIKYAP